ncbi:hypothetical protein M8J75_006242 [Diaphorina citri]|nr:hypothetical protein M8J75_006242 [Diaphorina citri]
MASKTPIVYLGFIDEQIRESGSSSVDFTANKIGGKPVWTTDINNSTPSCKICGIKLVLVVQLYAPLENSPYHRSLFVFACINSNCWNQNKSWVCIRCQVIDPTYTVNNPTQQSKVAVNQNLSQWCGDADDWGSDSEADDENGNIETGMDNLTVSGEDSNLGNGASSMGATGFVTTPVATAEIEGGEGDVVEIESPIGTQVNVMSLLHASMPVPQVSSQCFQFVPHYLNFEPETLDCESSPDSHVASLLHAYAKSNPVDNALSSAGAGGGGEGYEKSAPGHGDKMFHRFVSRIRHNPGHVVRYCRDDCEVLWMSRAEVTKDLKCSHCASPLTFECQLLSTLIPSLLLQLSPQGSGEEGHLEFGCGSPGVCCREEIRNCARRMRKVSGTRVSCTPVQCSYRVLRKLDALSSSDAQLVRNHVEKCALGIVLCKPGHYHVRIRFRDYLVRYCGHTVKIWRERPRGGGSGNMSPPSPPATATHGHTFSKKTFHKPTYCHHCTDMLWGLIQQGYICEVCNFVVHDRCLKTVVSACSSIAANLIKNPVAHCWSEQSHHKRKFCNVCRKRLDESGYVCEYFVHAECQDFAVADCKENATYVPGKELAEVHHEHHWREGNLPSNSKCAVCKKTCWSAECLAGYRCEWCGTTCHAACKKNIPVECNFGNLEPIYLPPHAVSIPRTEVPMEAIIGVQIRRKDTIISEEFSSGESRHRDSEDNAASSSSHSKDKGAKEKEDRDEETIKVYDGNLSVRRRIFRPITVSRLASLEHILTCALRAFHITKNPENFFLTDLYSPNCEAVLADPSPIMSLTRQEGKRPAVYLRFKDNSSGEVRVYGGKLQTPTPYSIVPVNDDTSIADLIRDALKRFGFEERSPEDYRLSEILLDRGVLERTEKPWKIVKQLGKESIRQMELMRFYLQWKQDPHGPNLALFVGNLPQYLTQRNYENVLTNFLGSEYKFSSIGPIYYEYGSMVITYEDANKAVKALYILRESSYEEKHLLVMLLPNIEPSMTPPGVQPLLVFVNVKSGGCQGLELISNFRKLLNPYQVFDLDNGGPLPGLYVFRHIQDYKILVCGGDGTIGWVLQCLDNVGQDSECSSPPCAIVPLGTGNDLARVLRWGSGLTGGEDPLSLLRDVIEAEEIRLDRWTVVFHPEDKEEKNQVLNSNTGGSEDNTQILVMNNYFGIGIDADLCLDFHNAREENPNKFKSRIHNKGVYVKMGLYKMIGRKMCKDLHREIRLEVDGKHVELPPVEGIIILNILSWGSGANPWGPDKEDQFSTPNHWDGMLEVVGVTGVVHLGQIQSGMRTATRIAQGGHIKIRLNSEMPVQVDGEPWIQGPSDVVILKSALKATMLKKSKIKRRNTEPSIGAGAGTTGAPSGEPS